MILCMKNKLITIVFIALAATIGGFFIVRDIKNSPIADTTDMDSPSSPSSSGPSATTLTASHPTLDRPIEISAKLTQQETMKMVKDITELQENLKQNSEYGAGWLQLGILRKFIGDYEGAAIAWKQASVLRPTDWVPANNLGDLYHYYLKNFIEAEKYLKQTIANEPTNAFAYKNLSNLYQLSYKEKINLAEGALLDGLKRLPTNTDLMVALAEYYREKGDKAKAKEYYQKAIDNGAPNKDALMKEINSL